MAKSQIIQDLLSKEDNLENVMLRLKAIFYGLGDRSLYEWIDYEVNGYPDTVEVPEYRKIGITPTISYVTTGWQATRVAAPVFHLSEEDLKAVTTYFERGGIGTLKDNKDCGFSYNPYLTHRLGEGYDRPVSVSEAFGRLPVNAFSQIKINVKNKVLDILLDLENRFGNLDDLDVLSNLGEEEKEVAKTIIKNYISMGNNNVVKGSQLGLEVADE